MSPGLASRGFAVRLGRPEDEAALLELHRAAFPGHPPRRSAEWRWKYVDNPLRRTEIVLVAGPDGQLAAAYGGISHRLQLAGEPVEGGLQVDVAVAPAYQRTPTAVALVAASGRRWFDEFAGGAVRLTWGYPEPGLQRIGLRHLRFEVLRDVNFLVREVGSARASGAPRGAGLQVDPVARFGAIADRLWSSCTAALPTATIRDARYLDWRYADQPDLAHLLLVVRGSDGAPRGLAVAREGGWSEQALSVMDWLVPPDDRAAEAALVERLVEEARARGRGYVVAWFAGAHDQWFRFQRDHAFYVQPTPHQECFRSWSARAGRRWLAQHWYQTMGDIDFF